MTDQGPKWDRRRLPAVRLRVGVAGHRAPPKLPDRTLGAVRAGVDHILAAVGQAARQHAETRARGVEKREPREAAVDSAEPAQVVIVSQLAEGADRIVAEAGLAGGFALEAVLPFAAAEFVKDFATQGSRDQFGALHDRATSVFTLDGSPNERPSAYEAAGLVMLANIDLLIAIWDGNEADGIGGTGQMVRRAIADRIPVIWIDPERPDAVRLSFSAQQGGGLATANRSSKETFHAADPTFLSTAIAGELFPGLQADGRRSLRAFLTERRCDWNYCPWFPLLLWIFVGRAPRWEDFRLSTLRASTQSEWKSYFATLPSDTTQRPAIETVLLPAYDEANHLSIYYSLLYRGAYVFSYVFAAIAVMLALGGVFIHDPNTKSALVLAEFAIIVAILFTWLRGNRQQWHQRWLDYRRLAESLRLMRILCPLGLMGPVDRPGGGLMNDEQDWVRDHAWSLRRLLPVPDRTVDGAYLAAVRDTVRSAEIAGQLTYHVANQKRMNRLDHRMHAAGEWLFGTTGVLCVLFLGIVWGVGLPHGESAQHSLGVFTFVTALLPTLGSALGAIHFQGEFKTVASQSCRIALWLTEIDNALATEPPTLARLTDRVEKISGVMMADHTEWQTVFRARALALPA